MVTLRAPLAISTRLLPAVQIGNAWLSLEPGGVVEDRLQWRYFLDVAGEEIGSGADLASAPQYTDDEEGTRAAFGALLSFLTACAESYPGGENADLFPTPVAEWACQHDDEIAMLREEIEGSDD
jgi:hypothetical protein